MPGRPVPDFWWPAAGRRERKRAKKSVGRRATFFPFEKREGEPEKKATDEKKPAKKENQKTSRFKRNKTHLSEDAKALQERPVLVAGPQNSCLVVGGCGR